MEVEQFYRPVKWPGTLREQPQDPLICIWSLKPKLIFCVNSYFNLLIYGGIFFLQQLMIILVKKFFPSYLWVCQIEPRHTGQIICVQPLFILFQSILRKRWKKLFLSEGSVILLQVHLFITARNYFVLVLTYSTLEHLTCDLVELHVLS